MLIDNNELLKFMDKVSDLELKKETRSSYEYHGRIVPRITEVLSAMLHKDSLMNWSNSLGWKRISYKAFMKDAADKGTLGHLAIEKFLREGSIDVDSMNIVIPENKECVISILNGFTSWWNTLIFNHNVKVVFLEETLIHKYFAGTCDCLLKVDDQYWLIDFKTSNHMNYNYCLQLAAYRFLLKEIKNIDIDRCLVLRLDKVNGNYYTYEFDMHNKSDSDFIDNCLQTFMLLSVAFKLRNNTEVEYDARNY